MANPWLELPEHPPWVLACDEATLARFNARAIDRHRLHFDALPEPFIGRPDAPVVLLNLNPGYTDDDPEVHAHPRAQELIRANLAHETGAFYYYDPHFDGSPAPGSLWWRKRLGPLAKATSAEAVARGVLVIELFPYHSFECGTKRGPWVPSQDYAVELARSAMRRDAVVIMMRSFREWEAAVPELAGYSRAHRVSNVQAPWISAGNCPAGFDQAVAALAQ